MNTGWSDGRNLGGAVYNRTVKSVLFDHSTFNGIWIQNGGFFADSLTLDGCTFNAYENKTSANDSNPLWFCNIRTCDVTVKNCTFKASRPIKVVEQAVFGANVTITDNKFDMSLTNSANDASKPKNDAIMFSTLIGETQWNPAGTLGNVVVSGNEVTGATALLTFFNPSQITMANGATFKVSNNELGAGVKESVVWKSSEELTPDYVQITPAPTPSTGGYYYYPSTDTKTDDTTKGSPKTFDAGVGIYAVTAVLSVTGMAWTAKKRH